MCALVHLANALWCLYQLKIDTLGRLALDWLPECLEHKAMMKTKLQQVMWTSSLRHLATAADFFHNCPPKIWLFLRRQQLWKMSYLSQGRPTIFYTTFYTSFSIMLSLTCQISNDAEQWKAMCIGMAKNTTESAIKLRCATAIKKKNLLLMCWIQWWFWPLLCDLGGAFYCYLL